MGLVAYSIRHTEQADERALVDVTEGNPVRAALTVCTVTMTNVALTALCVSGLCASMSIAGVQTGVLLPSAALTAVVECVEAAVRVAGATGRAARLEAQAE